MKMNLILEGTTILLIFIGAGIMLLAGFWIRKILRIISTKQLFLYWQRLFALTIFFMAGYLSSIALILIGQANYILVASGIIFAMGALFVYFVGRVSFVTIQEYQITASSLSATSDKLKYQQTMLESQFQLHTQDIELRSVQLLAVSEIAQTITMILNINELLDAIANLISHRFDHYRVSIFLIDEEKENSFLNPTISEGGMRIFNQQNRHRLDTNSIVGLAASRHEITNSFDFKTETILKASSELPETFPEVAFPLLIGAQLIGILDVQNINHDRFTVDNISILSTLANIVAIAIQNTLSFDQLRKALSTSEKGYQQMTQQKWMEISKKPSNPGYRYAQKRVTQIKDPSDIVNMKLKASQDEVIITSDPNQPASITIPIKLRDEVIGVLNINSSIDRKKWSTDEIAIVKAIADHGGQALENARLLQDSQQRASKERIIGEITSRISSAANMENILKTAVQELGTFIPDSVLNRRFIRRAWKSSQFEQLDTSR